MWPSCCLWWYRIYIVKKIILYFALLYLIHKTLMIIINRWDPLGYWQLFVSHLVSHLCIVAVLLAAILVVILILGWCDYEIHFISLYCFLQIQLMFSAHPRQNIYFLCEVVKVEWYNGSGHHGSHFEFCIFCGCISYSVDMDQWC